jgi:hypothetical protein
MHRRLAGDVHAALRSPHVVKMNILHEMDEFFWLILSGESVDWLSSSLFYNEMADGIC